MSEFPYVSLASLADVVMGQSPGANSCNNEAEGLPFLQGSGEFGRVNPTTPTYCLAPLRVGRAGSVLISVRAPVGSMNYADQNYCIGRGLAAIRAKKGLANAIFLKHAVELNSTYLHRRSQGSTFAAVSSDNVRAVPIPKFCFDKQNRLGIIFACIDSAIEKTEALIQKYQQIKAGLTQDLFTRGVLPNGKLRRGREHAPELYQETAIGWIPLEWQVVRMIDLANDCKGSTTIGPFGSDLVATDYRLEGVPVVFVRDVKEAGFVWNSETYVSQAKARRLRAHGVKAGDVLASKMGLPPCVSCLYPEWMPNGVITADMIRLAPNGKNVDGYWLTMAINHDRVKRQVAAITAGVTRAKVTLTDFRNIKIAKPDLNEQKLSSARIRVVQSVIDAEMTRVAKLQLQKKGLMQDLLTGKVAVKVDNDNMESA